jgi:DnaJ family protein C protein 17
MADVDPYAVLGLAPGMLSDAEIKKAYRKKALVLHPDKRKDSERDIAQKEFDALQKAYDVLLDPQARKALEDLAKARAATRARFDAQDSKRRKLREDLERRERAAERGETEEEEAKERLRVELLRLRRDFASRKKKYDVHSAEPLASETPETTTIPMEPAGLGKEMREAFRSSVVVPEHLFRTVKVTWREDVSDYPVAKLRDIFSRHGTVEDVVIREGKKKKGSALVVFSELKSAAEASNAVHGDATNPLFTARVATPNREATGRGDAHTTSKETFPESASPLSPAAAPPPFSSSSGTVSIRDRESVVLDGMRRAQKARIAREAEAENRADE